MPRRTGNLGERLTSFENLILAHLKARRGKRKRPDVAAFECDLETNALVLARELKDRSYRPGSYRTFTIFEPKARLIGAASYRDRVVHHALMNVLTPILDARLDHYCYACRKGKGTHAALDQCTRFLRCFPFAWHGDIRKFFPSIDHILLKDHIAGVVKDPLVLWLAGILIDSSFPQEEVLTWFPGDDLFTPLDRPRGIPIGNLTSQWFANFFLGPFDRFVRQTLGILGYLRYCDDFCLFAHEAAILQEALMACNAFLRSHLRLELNPKSIQVEKTAGGIAFLGFRLFPHRRRILPASLTRSVRRLKRRILWEGPVLDRKGRLTAAMPWMAHVSHARADDLAARVLTRLAKAGRRRLHK